MGWGVAGALRAGILLALAGVLQAQPRVLVLDDLGDQGAHAQRLQSAILRSAPQAKVRTLDAGKQLGSLVAALSQVDPSAWDLLLLGIAHPGFNQSEYDALLRLHSAGLTLIAPAGNAGGIEPRYPASYPFVISVGAADEHGHRASDSSLHPNQKLLMPSADGSSFAAADLAGHAARLLSQGQPKAGLGQALLARRKGHEAGPRVFESDDGAAQRPAAPVSAPKPKRRRPGHALLMSRARLGASEWIARVRAEGARVEHLIPGAGAIVDASDASLARLQKLDWVDSVGRSAAPPSGPAQARLAALWKDLYEGGLEARGLEGNLEPGGALVGCTAPPAQLDAGPSEALQRQGRWAPSPPLGASYYDTSSYLAGRVAVGVFLAESNGSLDPNNCNWTAAQEALVQAKITAAMAWLAAQNPSAQVEFVYDWHFKAACDYEPVRRTGYPFSATWTQNVVAKKGFSSVRDYNDKLRKAADADWAFSIFVANDVGYAPSQGFFTDGRFAFAYLGGPYQVMTYSNDNWGIANMDSVCAHETGHIFGALDEYAGPCSPTRQSGYFGQATSNCVSGGSTNHTGCPMRGVLLAGAGVQFCPSSRLQLGWRDQDADAKTDVLDTVPAGVWSAPVPSGGPVGSSVPVQGVLTDMALASPFGMNAVTLNSIQGAEARLNGGAWGPVSFDDGAADESQEAFSLLAGPLAPGSNLLELRAYNSAGNTQTAFLTLNLVAGTPTATRTATATRSPSPSLSPSPTAGPSFTATPSISAGPSATSSPTFAPSATPLPGGPCGGMPSLSSVGITGTSTQMARFFMRGGVLHLYTLGNGGTHLLTYAGGVWTQVPGSPFIGSSYSTALESQIDPDTGDLWFMGYSLTCGGCLPTGSLTAFRWNGSSVTETSVIYPSMLNAPRMVFHQGRPWILDGRGSSGLLLLSYQGGAWVEEGLVTLPNSDPVALFNQDAVAFSNGESIVVPLHNMSSSGYEIWAYKNGDLSLLSNLGGGAYSFSAGLARDSENAFIVFHGSSLRAVRIRLSDLALDEVSEGLNERGSFAHMDAYGGGEGIFVAAGRQHDQGPWVDHLRFNGTRWDALNCGVGLPASDVSTMLVENGRFYTALIEMVALSFYDCPLSAACPNPSATHSPTPGAYQSPSATRTATRTRTVSPWPTLTPSPTLSPTPPGSFTPTPSPTPHLCGTVLRVCLSGGCPFSSVAAAIAVACPGDTIEVEGGYYVEPTMVVDKDLSIVGVTGYSMDGPILRPVLEHGGLGPVLGLDLSAPRSVTLTNLALRHALDNGGVGAYMVAGSRLHLERLDLKGSASWGVAVNGGDGIVSISHCAFWGFEQPGGAGIQIDTSSSAGQADIRYNSFLAPAPALAISLSTGNSYVLNLEGNLAFNAGGAGTAALDLKGNPAASGDYQAWWGYSNFHGGLAPGANDLGAVLPDFGALAVEDPRYTTLSSLAFAGGGGFALDYYSNTRPAQGQTQWSIGAAEPVSPSPSPSRTRTPTRSPTPSAGPSPAPNSPTLTPSPISAASATASPSTTPSPTRTSSANPSPTASPSPSASGTVTLSATPSATSSATLSPTLSPTPSIATSATGTLSPTALFSATPSPVASGERPVILRTGVMPNPDPRTLLLRLSDPAEKLSVRFYGPAMVLLEAQDLGPAPAGWSQHILAVNKERAWRGPVFLRITAESAGHKPSAAVARAYYTR